MTWPQYLRNECSVDGRVVALAGRQRDILATLLVRHPSPVTLADMVDALWPEVDNEPGLPERAVWFSIRRLSARIGARLYRHRGFGWRLDQEEMRLAA